MNTLKILIEGHAKNTKTGWVANSSVVLIKSGDKNIIVDPGLNREKLLKSLADENLNISDIDYVFLTHGHIDHALLAGIFENAIIVDELYTYQKNLISKHNGVIPDTDLKIIRTPGHMHDHCSLIVKTRDGVYAVAGDVFWWTDDQEQIVEIEREDNDPEHMDLKKLIESRKKLLQLADYIIPGHGKIFKVGK